MSYTGDVYDTPPPIVRVAMTVACAFGAVLMLWQLFQVGFVISIILTIAGLILSVYLIWSVPRASQTALATVGYWAMLAGLALFLPFG